MKQKKDKTFRIMKKKRFMKILLNYETLLIKKKNANSDHDDLNYFGVRELENIFTNDDYNDHNYYKPVLVKSSFENNYEYYVIRGDKDKKLSIKQYLSVVMSG